MSNRQVFFILFFILGSLVSGKSQIIPPDFLCVKNDSLFWELPTNNCGPFLSYEIYVSTSEAGPYTLLSAVTTINQTNFSDPNPTGETRYYFLQSNFDCPGLSPLSSDTLDNRPPTVSPIIRVSVDNDLVLIDWEDNTSPEVTEYIIFRTTPAGTLPIDTVSASEASYIDLNSTPNQKVESYYIIAQDACGNTSIFDVPHFSIFLETAVNVCEQSIELNWNRYQNWRNGLDFQEIWYSTNGEPSVLLATLAATDSAFLFTDTNKGDEYCFFIRAQEVGTGIESISNIQCLTPNIVEPVRELYLKNVSVTPNNEVDLSWSWNNDAEISIVEILEAESPSTLELQASFSANLPLTINNDIRLDQLNPQAGKLFFQVQTFDACDSLAQSNLGTTIHLSGQALSDLRNALNWTAFDIEGATINNYQIFRIVAGQESLLETVDGNTLLWNDPVDVSNSDESNVCYYIQAEAIFTDENGQEDRILSRSNVICVEQQSNIITPNAFAPAGINNEFKPILVFGEQVDYLMQIYDRWGGKIFESRDAQIGWNGRKDFYEYPGGVYTYFIRITQSNGRIVEDSGTLVLIR